MARQHQLGILALIARWLPFASIPRNLSAEELEDFGVVQDFVSSSVWDELYGREEPTRFDLMMQIVDINEILVSLERSCVQGFEWSIMNTPQGTQMAKIPVSREDAEQTKMLLVMRLNLLRKKLSTMRQ